jgi:predicted transcriptional regulator
MVRIMQRRCKFDIIVAILDVVSSGATKTKIVYEANLNFNLATKYLDLLQEKKFVRINSNVYEITKEGKTFLKKAKELHI